MSSVLWAHSEYCLHDQSWNSIMSVTVHGGGEEGEGKDNIHERYLVFKMEMTISSSYILLI